jgi:hypothetical protein
LKHHDAQPVPHDVMKLACDSGALGNDGSAGAFVALLL